MLDTSEVIPIFGIVIDIILITADQPYLVCEVLTTEEFSAHLHSFVVKKEAKPVPIVFCQPHELSDYHTLGLYSLRFFHETTLTHYIVPQYDYIDNFNST